MVKSVIHYKGKAIVIETDEPIRKGVCSSCRKSIDDGIKVTQRHHWWYAYHKSTVVKNPKLALDNTDEYCFYCHRIADALRTLSEINDPVRIMWVFETAPDYIKERFNKVVDTYLKMRSKSGKNKTYKAK